MTWTDIWEWPYRVAMTDGYLTAGPKCSGSANSASQSAEEDMAQYLYGRARKLHLRPGARASLVPVADHVHVWVVGQEGRVDQAPGPFRTISHGIETERDPRYRMIIFGFDTQSIDPSVGYGGDLGGWVYAAGMRRQKVRASRKEFVDACRPLLAEIRRTYLDSRVVPTSLLAGYGIPVAFAGD